MVVTGRALAGRLLRGVGRIMRPWATMDTGLAGAVTGAIGASRNGRRVLPRSEDEDEDDWGGRGGRGRRGLVMLMRAEGMSVSRGAYLEGTSKVRRYVGTCDSPAVM